MENKCVICGGPVGENAIPSRVLAGGACLEGRFPDGPCDFLDKALGAASYFRDELRSVVDEFEDKCTLHTSFDARRNGGFRHLYCGYLPAIRQAICDLEKVLDSAIANPGGPNVQE